jgi:hypothetical protein
MRLKNFISSLAIIVGGCFCMNGLDSIERDYNLNKESSIYRERVYDGQRNMIFGTVIALAGICLSRVKDTHKEKEPESNDQFEPYQETFTLPNIHDFEIDREGFDGYLYGEN